MLKAEPKVYSSRQDDGNIRFESGRNKAVARLLSQPEAVVKVFFY